MNLKAGKATVEFVERLGSEAQRVVVPYAEFQAGPGVPDVVEFLEYAAFLVADGELEVPVAAGFLLKDGPLDDAAVFQVYGLLVRLGQGCRAAKQRGTEEKNESLHIQEMLFWLQRCK